jgi:hypothetical protein
MGWTHSRSARFADTGGQQAVRRSEAAVIPTHGGLELTDCGRRY